MQRDLPKTEDDIQNQRSRLVNYEKVRSLFGLNELFTDTPSYKSEANKIVLSLLEYSPMSIIIYNPDHTVLFWNRKAEQIYGWTEEEVLGKPIPVIPRRDQEASNAILSRLKAGETFSGLEVRGTHRDGHLLHLRLSIAPLKDTDGTVAAFLSIGEDITDSVHDRHNLYLNQFALQNASIGIVRVDENAKIVEVNEQFCRNLGYSRDELLHMGIKDIDPTFTNESWQKIRNWELQEGSILFETIQKRKDGTLFPVEIHASSGEYDGEKFSISFVQDITRRKRSEEAVKSSESKYRRLHETMTDAFLHMDLVGNILESNRSFQQMIGYSENELQALSISSITPEKWHSTDEKIVAEQILLKGSSNIYEKEFQRKNGTVFPVEVRSFLLRDDEGQPSSIWGIIRDISDRQKAQEERLQLELQLMQSMKMESIGRLAGGIAHDFNNMLNVIIGHTEIVLEGFDPESETYKELQEVYSCRGKIGEPDPPTCWHLRARQTIQPEILDLNSALNNMLKMPASSYR